MESEIDLLPLESVHILTLCLDQFLGGRSVKLKAGNKLDFNRTHTQKGKEDRIRRYSRRDCFLEQPVEDIIDAGYYQLMRFWLIGAWTAENQNLDFYLLNLVRENDEKTY